MMLRSIKKSLKFQNQIKFNAKLLSTVNNPNVSPENTAKLDLVSADYLKISKYIKKAFGDFYPNFKEGDIDLSSCDYLNLCSHPELNRVDAESILNNGRIHFNRSGCYPRDPNSSVRIFEAKMADYMGGEAACFVNSGTEANITCFQGILQGNNIPVYLDKYAHATMALGCRSIGRNDMMYFEHNNIDSLKQLIDQYGPGLVGIDSVYSAYGTIAPIEEMNQLCRETGCIFLVDESHTLGINGKDGSGLVKELGLEKDIPYRTTSTGKSFAGGGGLIITNEEASDAIEALRISTMSVFSLAPQECLADRMLATLDVIKRDEWRREELQRKSLKFRNGCVEMGFNGTYVRGTTPILAFVVGPYKDACEMFLDFVSKGIHTSAHVYPASPRNKSVVRFTVCNSVSDAQIDKTLEVLKELRSKYKPETWPDATGEAVF